MPDQLCIPFSGPDFLVRYALFLAAILAVMYGFRFADRISEEGSRKREALYVAFALLAAFFVAFGTMY